MKALILFITLIMLVASCQQEEIEPTPPTPPAPSNPSTPVTDIDGNEYATVQIGTQVWMAENLRTTTYANGDPIPNVTEPTLWSSITTGATCHYSSDSLYENPFGKLYNGYAVDDSRNVCPNGWHVPTAAEWTVLSDYLGGNEVAGVKMKSTGFQYWLNSGIAGNEGTNESGFSGLPGGFSGISLPYFYQMNIAGNWWSSTTVNFNQLTTRWLNYGSPNLHISGANKVYGHSVRCLKD